MSMTKSSLTTEEMLYRLLSGHSYRAIAREAGITHPAVIKRLCPPKEIIHKVKGRADRRCESCSVLVQNGHIHQRGSMGTEDFCTHVSNLQHLCLACHRQAHGIGVT